MLSEDQWKAESHPFKQIVPSLGNIGITKALFSSENGSGQRQGVPLGPYVFILGPHAFSQINAIFI